MNYNSYYEYAFMTCWISNETENSFAEFPVVSFQQSQDDFLFSEKSYFVKNKREKKKQQNQLNLYQRNLGENRGEMKKKWGFSVLNVYWSFR